MSLERKKADGGVSERIDDRYEVSTEEVDASGLDEQTSYMDASAPPEEESVAESHNGETVVETESCPDCYQLRRHSEGWSGWNLPGGGVRYPPDCMGYRYPQAGFEVGVRTGRYMIQPDAQIQPFWVSCQMTYAGGGWTLVLKADGRKPTFHYDSPLWSNTTTHPPNAGAPQALV
ncbi:MAG: fibrinogen-like YCDxxxxGGGW domain-containing protein, partial [Myxococcota bacterium]